MNYVLIFICDPFRRTQKSHKDDYKSDCKNWFYLIYQLKGYWAKYKINYIEQSHIACMCSK